MCAHSERTRKHDALAFLFYQANISLRVRVCDKKGTITHMKKKKKNGKHNFECAFKRMHSQPECYKKKNII